MIIPNVTETNKTKYTTSCELTPLIEVDVLLSVLSSSLVSSLALKDVLTVLVQLQLSDLNLGSINTNLAGRSVHLLASESFDVNHPLSSVDFSDLSFSALERTTGDLHLISLDNRNSIHLNIIPHLRIYVVLILQGLAQRRRHHHTTNVRRSSEMSLTGSATRRRNTRTKNVLETMLVNRFPQEICNTLIK